MKKSKRSFSLEDNDGLDLLPDDDPKPDEDEEIIDLYDVIEVPEELTYEDEDLSLDVEFLDAETGLSIEGKEEKEEPAIELFEENAPRGITPLLDLEEENEAGPAHRVGGRRDDDVLEKLLQDDGILEQPSGFTRSDFAALKIGEETAEEPATGGMEKPSAPAVNQPGWGSGDDDILDVDSEEEILRLFAELKSDSGDEDDLLFDTTQEALDEKPDISKAGPAVSDARAAVSEVKSSAEPEMAASVVKSALTGPGKEDDTFATEKPSMVPVPEKHSEGSSPPGVPSLEELVSRIESNLMDVVKDIVEARLPEIVRSILREEIEKLERESR